MTPAEAYEHFLVPAIFEPWARTIVRSRPPAPGSRVLDLACGTGIGARLAAPFAGRTGTVVGLDADDGMLSVARRTRARGDDAAIEWLLGSALELPFQASEFDYLLCLEGLQFFADRSAGLREMRRVLRPGGLLVGSVWGPIEQNPGYHALAEGLRRFVSADAGRLPPLALPDAGAIRALVVAAGFGEVTVNVESLHVTVPSADALVDWLAAGGPTIRHNLARLRDDQRPAFSDFVTAWLAPHRTAHGLSVPSTRNVIVAR